MHPHELVELAALVSAHGPTLVQSNAAIPVSSVEQYWTTSKVRLDRWARSLKDLGQEKTGDAQRLEQSRLSGVIEEVLTTEILTRVWTAVLAAHDRTRDTQNSEPVARSVMIGHMEARHRALTLLLQGRALDDQAVATLNNLRRRAERWTDLLVGYIAGKYDVSEFAVEPDRAKEFAEDFHRQGCHQAWPLLLASLRAAFPRGLVTASLNADLNARIASSIISCFPAESFDSTGLFRSLWLMRLMTVAEDTQDMIEELLRPALATT